MKITINPSLKKIFKSEQFVLFLILATAFLLLCYVATTRSLWMDETAVLEYYYQNPNPFIFLRDYFILPDNHPPLYYFLVIIVYNILPFGELAIRMVSIIASLGIISISYLLANLIFKDKIISTLSILFISLSPYFLQYGQMARYHSLTAFFVLTAIYFLIKFLYQAQSRKNLVLFLTFFLLTGYADLPNFVYLTICCNIWYALFLWQTKDQKQLKSWVIGQLTVFILFLPIVWLYYVRVRNGDGDFTATSLLGNGVLDLFFDFSIHFYQFTYGETIMPWNYIFFTMGLFLLTSVGIMLFKNVKNNNVKTFSANHLLLLIIGLVLCNTIFLNVLNPRYNFITYPRFVFAAFPLFVILIVGVINSFKRKSFSVIIFSLFLLIQLMGTFNLIKLKNYLNASYFRSFESFEYVRDNSMPGDIVYINGDLNIGLYKFYHDKYFYNITSFMSYDSSNYDELKKGTRVWFFSTGSDDQNINHSPESKIPSGFNIINNKFFTPVDYKLNIIKKKMLKRESYEYKYGIFLLEKK